MKTQPIPERTGAMASRIPLGKIFEIYSEEKPLEVTIKGNMVLEGVQKK